MPVISNKINKIADIEDQCAKGLSGALKDWEIKLSHKTEEGDQAQASPENLQAAALYIKDAAGKRGFVAGIFNAQFGPVARR